jgi:hypothetical protein
MPKIQKWNFGGFYITRQSQENIIPNATLFVHSKDTVLGEVNMANDREGSKMLF